MPYTRLVCESTTSVHNFETLSKQTALAFGGKRDQVNLGAKTRVGRCVPCLTSTSLELFWLCADELGEHSSKDTIYCYIIAWCVHRDTTRKRIQKVATYESHQAVAHERDSLLDDITVQVQ